jgi:hypothetical protein
MKGDRVEIVVDAGDTTRTYEIKATRAGRRVDTSIRRGVVEVAEVTRGGTTVRTARFMASRILALIEHPAPRTALADDLPPEGGTQRGGRSEPRPGAQGVDAA